MLRKCVASTLPLELLQRHRKAILDALNPFQEWDACGGAHGYSPQPREKGLQGGHGEVSPDTTALWMS